jgi:hypothetical protein
MEQYILSFSFEVFVGALIYNLIYLLLLTASKMTYNVHQSFIFPKVYPKLQLLSIRKESQFLAYSGFSKSKDLQEKKKRRLSKIMSD